MYTNQEWYEGLRNRNLVIVNVYLDLMRSMVVRECRKKNITNETDIDDIAQESFIQMLKGINKPDFEPRVVPIAYTTGITQNIIKDYWRKVQRTRGFRPDESGNIPDEPNDSKQERNETIRKILETLGKPCSTILELYYFEKIKDQKILELGVLGTQFTNEGSITNRRLRCIREIQKRYIHLLKE